MNNPRLRSYDLKPTLQFAIDLRWWSEVESVPFAFPSLVITMHLQYPVESL